MRIRKEIETLQRRCTELEARLEALQVTAAKALAESRSTPAELEDFRKEMASFRLDYEELYETARTNLSKLAGRAKAAADGNNDKPTDAQLLARGRRMLAERKLQRG